MYKGPLETIVLTSLQGGVDVICFHSAFSFDAFKAYAARLDIGWERISAADAAKLLAQSDGIGAGCYTMIGTTNESEREYRKAVARIKKHEVISLTGIGSIFEPLDVELDEPTQRTPPDLTTQDASQSA